MGAYEELLEEVVLLDSDDERENILAAALLLASVFHASGQYESFSADANLPEGDEVVVRIDVCYAEPKDGEGVKVDGE